MILKAEKCSCNSNYYIDRKINGKFSCPACDPELGSTVEIRIENYKKLIGHPVPDFVKEILEIE